MILLAVLDQQVKRGDLSALLGIVEATPGVLSSALGPPVRGRPGHTGGSPTEGH